MAGETVLAVDDRNDSLKFLQEYILEPHGYKMISARDGAAAMKIVQAQKIDLIISDLVMPTMGGLELLESLREQDIDIPTILMTFHGSEGTAVKAFRLGARDYIMKPFAIDEMLTAINHALAESRLRQERDNLTTTIFKVNQQLENRVQELRFLYGIGRSVTSLKDLGQILIRIVEAAVYLTRAEEGAIMLLDPQSDELYLRAARGMGEKNARNFRMKVEDSIAGQVLRTGRPLMIGGLNKNDAVRVASDYFVKSLLNVPLKDADQVIGVLAVNQKSNARPFTDIHLNLLMALADYASIAIQNARLYTQLTAAVSNAEEASRELEKIVNARTTELQAANQQLRKTEDLASLGSMAAGVAREMVRSLTGILTDLEQLSQESEAPLDKTRLLAGLKQETVHGRDVAQSLLDFAHQSRHQPQAINLNEVIVAAWSTYQAESQTGEQVEFVGGFDPDLPPVLLDPQQMKLAIYYLIRHACQSMASSGTLRATTRGLGDQVQVVISDTGQGLPAAALRHIFEPFHENNHHASGLDLSITYAVIQRHKGAIEVDSIVGQGTTFTIYLPKRM